VLDMSKPPPAQQSGADRSSSPATRAQRQSLPEGAPSAVSDEIRYTFSETAWKPSLIAAYKICSADDPTTARLERSVPLHYEGSPRLGRPVRNHRGCPSVPILRRLSLRSRYNRRPRTPSPSAMRISCGQAGQSDPGRAGTPPHLKPQRVQLGRWGGRNTISPMICSSNTNHIFNQHVFLTAGISACFPGAGIKAASPGKAPTWTGEFFNVVVNY